MLEILGAGGWMMWVILSVSVIASGIFLERFVSLFMLSALNADKFMKKIMDLVLAGNYAGAIEATKVRSMHPLPGILHAGLIRANRREKEIERAMEEKMLHAVPRLSRGVSFLGLLGNTATLLGLLGTIFGLITAFSGVSAASASARQQVLAEGISIAMYTTAFGLIVAVPILFAHNIITSRMDKMMVQTEEGAVALLVALAGRIREIRGLDEGVA